MGVLLMLITIGGLITAAVLLVISLVTKKIWLTQFTLAGVAVWSVFYVAMLFGFSFASTEKTLAMNEPKEFCGFYLDCHLHTEVTGVRTVKTIGDRTANGTFYVVNVKVFSDAKNPNIALHLIAPKARVVLTNGDKIEREMAAEVMLPTANVRLDTDIHNNETIEKEIVFDLPTDVREPRLDLREGYGIDHMIEAVLVDDEDSILHARTRFELREQNENASVK